MNDEAWKLPRRNEASVLRACILINPRSSEHLTPRLRPAAILLNIQVPTSILVRAKSDHSWEQI